MIAQNMHSYWCVQHNQSISLKCEWENAVRKENTFALDGDHLEASGQVGLQVHFRVFTSYD